MAEKKAEKPTVSEQAKVEKLFSKEQLLAAERFQRKRDVINATLEPDKKYTIKTVEQMIEKYMKGLVK